MVVREKRKQQDLAAAAATKSASTIGIRLMEWISTAFRCMRRKEVVLDKENVRKFIICIAWH